MPEAIQLKDYIKRLPTQGNTTKAQMVSDLEGLAKFLRTRVEQDLAGNIYGSRAYTDGARDELLLVAMMVEQLLSEASG